MSNNDNFRELIAKLGAAYDRLRYLYENNMFEDVDCNAFKCKACGAVTNLALSNEVNHQAGCWLIEFEQVMDELDRLL